MLACRRICGRPSIVECAGIRSPGQQCVGRAGIVGLGGRVERGAAAGVPGGHVSAVVHQPGDVGGCARRRSCMKRGDTFVVHSVDVRSSLDQGRGDLDPAVGRAGCGVERCRPAEAPGIDVCAGRQERQNRGER